MARSPKTDTVDAADFVHPGALIAAEQQRLPDALSTQADPDTGAPFTVRTFTVEPSDAERTGTRIVLKPVAPGQVAIVVPGSSLVKAVAALVGWLP